MKDFLNNPDTEVSKLSIFSLSYLQNYTVTMLPVVNYVIERLTYHLKNSPSLVWREQSLNIIGMLYNNELFIKQNDDIPTLDTMLTTIFNYVQSQVNEYQAKLNLSISTGDSGKKPKIDTLVNQLLKTLSTLSSIIKSTRRFLPTNDYIDIQRKYELANVNTLYKKILAVFAYMAPSIRTGMLPNEKARQYDDDMVYFSTELITEDKLKKMFAPPESNQYMVGSFQLSDQLLAENATTNTSVSYMNFAITQF